MIAYRTVVQVQSLVAGDIMAGWSDAWTSTHIEHTADGPYLERFPVNTLVVQTVVTDPNNKKNKLISFECGCAITLPLTQQIVVERRVAPVA